jgi:hypothetical protein
MALRKQSRFQFCCWHAMHFARYWRKPTEQNPQHWAVAVQSRILSLSATNLRFTERNWPCEKEAFGPSQGHLLTPATGSDFGYYSGHERTLSFVKTSGERPLKLMRIRFTCKSQQTDQSSWSFCVLWHRELRKLWGFGSKVIPSTNEMTAALMIRF